LRRPVLHSSFFALSAISSALACALYSQTCRAQDEQQAVSLKFSDSLIPPVSTPSKANTSKTPTFATADQASGRTDSELILQGNAQVRRDGTVITAERINYSSSDNTVAAVGAVRINKDGVVMLGDQLQLRMDSKEGYLAQASYSIGALGGRGFSSRINLLGGSRIQALDATYTTCEPGSLDWLLRTETLELDQKAAQGRTSKTQLYFKDQQILGVPFFFFPLGRQRQSGFLAPSLESNSRFGLGGVIPYYWNIAPNRDATIAPRFMSRRGLALENELRMLEPNWAAELKYDFNPNDTASGGYRYLLNFKTQASLPMGWAVGFNGRRVSDDKYLVDYGRNLLTSSETRLPVELTLARSFGEWNFSARAVTWQHLLDARLSPSYEQVPQLRLTTEQALGNFNFNFVSDVSKFAIDRPSVGAIGWRAVINPSISYPIQTPAYFVTPKIGVHASYYNLDRNPLGDKKLSRALPIFSIDSGLNFEREMTWRGQSFRQTLEPRVFYVKTPYRDQSTFPVFADTAATELNFAQLLSENSFVGNDRIADLNQLSTMLVSRIINPENGSERFRFAVGQRLYFSPQRVTIAATDVPRTDTRSDLLFAAGGELGKGISVDAGFQYSVRQGNLPRFNASIRYLPSDTDLVNFSYRYSKATNLNQLDTSWRWKVGPRWSTLGRLNYSFAKVGNVTVGGALDKPGVVELIVGAEYDVDCWTARAVVHRFVTADRKPTTQLFFQLELKGLGQIGLSPFEVLKRNIPGYRLPSDRPTVPTNFFGYD
jgi:LPS-assembly protein